jgi:CheY-like chemotaxis protein
MAGFDPMENRVGDPSPEDSSTGDPAAERADLFQHALFTLHEIQAALSQEADPGMILKVGTSAAVDMTEADCGAILIDAASGHGEFRYGRCHGRDLADDETELLAKVLEPFLAEVRQGSTSRLVLALDHRVGEAAPSSGPPAELRTHGLNSVLILGLASGGRRHGALVLGRSAEISFDQERLLLAEILAGQIAVQYERICRATEVEQTEVWVSREVTASSSLKRDLACRERAIRAIAEVARASGGPVADPEAISERLRRGLSSLRYDAGALHLFDAETSTLTLQAQQGLAAEVQEALGVLRPEAPEFCGAFKEDRPVVLEPACEKSEGPAGWARRGGFRALAIVPFSAGASLRGVLLAAGREERAIGPDETAALAVIGGLVALAAEYERSIARFEAPLDLGPVPEEAAALHPWDEAALEPGINSAPPPAAEPEAAAQFTEPAESAGVETAAAAPGVAQEKMRILVVDDEPALREIAGEILQSHGYEAILAKDGVEGLDIYRKEWGKISMVLLDMVMPRLSGLETFRRLVGMDRKARVLLCSGYGPIEKVKQAIKEGAMGLLPKPYASGDLVAWVEKARYPDEPSASY